MFRNYLASVNLIALAAMLCLAGQCPAGADEKEGLDWLRSDRKPGEQKDPPVVKIPDFSPTFTVLLEGQGDLDIEAVYRKYVQEGPGRIKITIDDKPPVILREGDGNNQARVLKLAKLEGEFVIRFQFDASAQTTLTTNKKIVVMQKGGTLKFHDCSGLYSSAKCTSKDKTLFKASGDWYDVSVYGNALLYASACPDVGAYEHSRLFADDCGRVFGFGSAQVYSRKPKEARAYGPNASVAVDDPDHTSKLAPYGMGDVWRIQDKLELLHPVQK